MKQKIRGKGDPVTLNKDRIIESISSRCGFSKKKSIAICESLLESIKSTLESGEPVLVSGFGKFEVQEKEAEGGRNPKNDREWILDGGRSVTFKCSPRLKDKMNVKWKH